MNNSRAPVEAVLFDLDGTLIATKRLYLEAYRRALEPHVGRLLSDDELLSHDARSERLLLAACLNAGDLDACHAAFHQHYDALHPSHFEGVYPGIPELLDRLRARGLKLGIVTGKSRGAWLVTEARVQLGPFDVIVVEDDVSAPKPDPHGLGLALSALSVAPGNALYVGDSIVDLRAALAVGASPVAVLWSKNGERRAAFENIARDLDATVVADPTQIDALLTRSRSRSR